MLKHGGRESNPHQPGLESGTLPIEHPPYENKSEKRDMRESNPRFLLDRQARFHYANTPKTQKQNQELETRNPKLETK